MYSKKNICRLAAVIFSGFSDKQIVRAKDSTLCKTSRYLLTYSLVKPLRALHELSSYPNLLCLLKILVTIAVTSCSAERVMSRVKIIKNRLRSTMNDDWFSSLTILASERDVMDSLAATDIIDTFAQCSSKLQNMLGVHCALSACGDNN